MSVNIYITQTSIYGIFLLNLFYKMHSEDINVDENDVTKINVFFWCIILLHFWLFHYWPDSMHQKCKCMFIYMNKWNIRHFDKTIFTQTILTLSRIAIEYREVGIIIILLQPVSSLKSRKEKLLKQELDILFI